MTVIPSSVLYLVHVASADPAKYSSLKASKGFGDQFPGVYFSIVTTQRKKLENLYPGKYIMIFSRELLKQHNYHINIRDYNGTITEKNTYFPWSLEKAVHRINKTLPGSMNNEVVFHDDIPLTYLCEVIRKPSVMTHLDDFLNFKMPTYQCSNRVLPDMSKLPFYAYNFEEGYTGIDPLKPSSNAFFKKLAKVANIHPIPDSTNEISKQLQEKAPYLWAHRNEQDINALRTDGGTQQKGRTLRADIKKYRKHRTFNRNRNIK